MSNRPPPQKAHSTKGQAPRVCAARKTRFDPRQLALFAQDIKQLNFQHASLDQPLWGGRYELCEMEFSFSGIARSQGEMLGWALDGLLTLHDRWDRSHYRGPAHVYKPMRFKTASGTPCTVDFQVDSRIDVIQIHRASASSDLEILLPAPSSWFFCGLDWVKRRCGCPKTAAEKIRPWRPTNCGCH